MQTKPEQSLDLLLPANQTQQRPLAEDPKKKIFFPNSHWVSKKDEKRGHKRTNTPCKRWGHSVILFENQMFLFGGSGNNNNTRNWETIYILNCDTYEWEKVCPNDALGTNTPEPRDSHACVRIGNNMYIFGGSNGENPLNDMFAFNLVSKTWVKIETSGEIPSPREGHSGVALHDRYFFIFGGWDGKNIFQNCYLFDYITKKWKMIEYVPGTEPLPRESHSCALIQDNIYIFGGQGTSIKKKDTYYNDLFRFKINIDKSLERVSGVWERLSSKNGIYPAPRTSHSIAAYKDRYLIVLGGEGYSSNNEVLNVEEAMLQARENGKNEPAEEQNNEESEDDDNHPPCFPKSDVWIYDTEDSTWNMLEVKNAELFLPRFTHSCAVYKDSLIIFGGLKDFKNSIDDLMILVLEDNDRKKPIHLCSCCKKMLDSESLEESHPVVPGKIGSELKIAPIPEEEQEGEHLDYAAYSKPFVSLSYLSDIVGLVQWPLAAFGLLMECAFIVNASELSINWEKKYKYGYNPSRVVIKDHSHLESFIAVEFNGSESLLKCNESNSNYLPEEQTSLFHKNMRFGALRLGETLFYVRKHGTVIELYYISTNLKTNPDLNDFITYNCAWDTASGNELSACFPQMKKCIMDNINHLFSEEELLALNAPHTIFVLNLRKMAVKSKRILELKGKNDDICLNVPKILETKRSHHCSVSHSLKSYLEHYFLVHPQIELYLNRKKISFSRVFSISKDFQKLENPEEFINFSRNMRILYGKKPDEKACVSNEKPPSIPKEEAKMDLETKENNNHHQEPAESGNLPMEKSLLETLNPIEFPGLLLYQNNKLVHQIDDLVISKISKNAPNLVIFGFVELENTIFLDFSKSSIENAALRLCFISKMIDFMRKFKEEKLNTLVSQKKGLEVEEYEKETPSKKIEAGADHQIL